MAAVAKRKKYYIDHRTGNSNPMGCQVLGCFGLQRLLVDSANLDTVLGKTTSLLGRLEMLWVGKSRTLYTVQPIYIYPTGE